MCLFKVHPSELPQTKTVTHKKKQQQSNVRHIQTEVQTDHTENSDTDSTSTEEGVFTIGNDSDKMKVSSNKC